MLNKLIQKVSGQISGDGLRVQLLRGGVGSLALKGGQGLLTFAVAVVLARVMGPEKYGVYSYILAIVMLIAVPAQLGIPQLIVRETAKNEANKNWSLINGLWKWGSRAVLIFSLFVTLILFGFISIISWSGEARGVSFALAAFLIPLIAISSVWSACLRGLRIVLRGQLSENIIRSGLLLLLTFIWIFSSNDNSEITPNLVIELNIASAFVAAMLSGFMLWCLKPKDMKREKKISYEISFWRKAVIPLAMISGLHLVNSYTDLIILGVLTSDEDVGIYRAVSQLTLLGAFGLTAINQVLHPQLARLYAQGDIARLQRLVTASAKIILSLAAAPFMTFVFFGSDLIEVLFGESYRAGFAVLIILATAQLANAAFGSVGALLNMTGHEKDTMKGMLIAMCANILLNIILIPIFGMNGAAIATAVSFFIWNALLRQYVKRRLAIESSALYFRFNT